MKQYNETIEKLIHLKVISLDQVLEFAYEYHMNKQLDQMMAEQEWECNQGTMHNVDEECDCPDYNSNMDCGMKIVNKKTGAVVDSGLDDFNAHLLINEYQNDDFIIVDNTNKMMEEHLESLSKSNDNG